MWHKVTLFNLKNSIEQQKICTNQLIYEIILKKRTLKKSLLSWPVAAIRRTDSAAPIVLARHAKMLLAVSCDICHSRGSTGTLDEGDTNNKYTKKRDQNVVKLKSQQILSNTSVYQNFLLVCVCVCLY